MKDGIILDKICCAYCRFKKECKIKNFLDNTEYSAFCSNYEKNQNIIGAKNFDENPMFILGK